MAEVFADTAGWTTFFIRTEPRYLTARRLVKQWEAYGTRVITTNYVLTELIITLTPVQ